MADEDDASSKLYSQFQKKHLARGLAARNPVIIQKKLHDLQHEVREKLVALGHPTYKVIHAFMKKPKVVNEKIFHQLVKDLDFRISATDASLLLRSMTGGRSQLSFHEFCRTVTLDQTLNWDEMKESTKPNGRKDYQKSAHHALHSHQHRAASKYGQENLAKNGIEALVEQQLKERTRHSHERTLLIKKIFDPYVDKNGNRLVRASKFAEGVRRLGVLVTDDQLKQAVHKYAVLVTRHGQSTRLIHLSNFLTKGLALPNPLLSPDAKILHRSKKKLKKEVYQIVECLMTME